jgi:hypothetical protein
MRLVTGLTAFGIGGLTFKRGCVMRRPARMVSDFSSFAGTALAYEYRFIVRVVHVPGRR